MEVQHQIRVADDISLEVATAGPPHDFSNLEQPGAFDAALQRFIDRHVTAAGGRT